MSDYRIITDVGCDIAPALLQEWGVDCIPLTFRFTDEDRDYVATDIALSDFYTMMREGRVAKTSAANMEVCTNCFEAALKEGFDVLYIGFSSALSGTSGTAQLAANALQERYPDHKLIVIDSLCASAGQGLLVSFAVEQKKAGKNIDEVAAFVRKTFPQIAHWFTVDDLVYLKRGGRLSSTAAFVGGLLNIKPVLHVDDLGRLVSVTKVRGRKLSLKAIAQKYQENALDTSGVYFISHCDCLDEAKQLEEQICKATGTKAALITDISPVIGSHSGPGTIAVFFLSKER